MRYMHTQNSLVKYHFMNMSISVALGHTYAAIIYAEEGQYFERSFLL